jgi:quinolinate synthase
LYLWPGLCAVHAKFQPAQVSAIRAQEPSALVYVHPECSPEVVQMADGAGSTTYLIKAVAEAKSGSTIYVGTEYSLVNRLAARHPDKTIRPLRRALCSNMAKVTEARLAAMLRQIGRAPEVRVEEHIARPARLALERMLTACT